MGTSIENLLENLTVGDLKQITKPLGLCKSISRKMDLMRCIEDFLVHHLDAVLAHLTDTEKLYVAELVHNDNCNPVAFSAKYNCECPFPQKWGWGKVKTPLYLLVTDLNGNEYPRVPNELVAPLRSLLPKPADAKIETVSEIPSVLALNNRGSLREIEKRPILVFEGERTVFQELRRMLSLVQSGKISVSDKSKAPTASAVKAATEALILPDFVLDPPEQLQRDFATACGPVRAYAWPVILQQAGWCKSLKGKLVLTAAGKKFISSLDAESYRLGIEQIIFNDDFDELNRIGHIRGQTGKAKRFLSAPSERKETICEALSQCPVNEWVSLSEVFRFLFAARDGYYVISDGFPLYLSEQRYGHLSGYEMGINKQYFRAFLFETLATLGLIDVAYVFPHGMWPEMHDCWGADGLDFCGRYDGLLFIRLTPLGAFCLSASDQYELPAAEASNSLKVLPNHEIIVTGSAESFSLDQHFLELIAVRKGDYSWVLDKQRILDYLETGGVVQEIRNFLRDASSEAVPSSIEFFLNDIESRIGVFGDSEEAILIEVNDPSAAMLIANHSKTNKFCFLAGDRRLAVIKKNIRAFRSALKKLGYVLP